MATLIVLDGWHAGHVYSMPVVRTLKLVRPRLVTVCECNPEHSHEFPSEPRAHEYQLCLLATDNSMALYSLSGKPDALVNGRTWIQRPGGWAGPAPLYVGCRDEHAVIWEEAATDAERLLLQLHAEREKSARLRSAFAALASTYGDQREMPDENIDRWITKVLTEEK